MFPEYKTLPDAPAAEPEPPRGSEWYGTRPGVADSEPALSGPTPDRHRLYLERAPLKRAAIIVWVLCKIHPP